MSLSIHKAASAQRRGRRPTLPELEASGYGGRINRRTHYCICNKNISPYLHLRTYTSPAAVCVPGSFTPYDASSVASSGCIEATALSSLITTRVPSRSSRHRRSSSCKPMRSPFSGIPALVRWSSCASTNDLCVSSAFSADSLSASSDEMAELSMSSREVQFSSLVVERSQTRVVVAVVLAGNAPRA